MAIIFRFWLQVDKNIAATRRTERDDFQTEEPNGYFEVMDLISSGFFMSGRFTYVHDRSIPSKDDLTGLVRGTVSTDPLTLIDWRRKSIQRKIKFGQKLWKGKKGRKFMIRSKSFLKVKRSANIYMPWNRSNLAIKRFWDLKSGYLIGR